MENTVEKILQNIEALLNNGKTGDAKHQLLQFDKANLAKTLKLQYARLARRAGLPSLSVRILYSSVYPDTGSAQTEEALEYAYALADQGVFSEAHELVKTLSSGPSTLLCSSYIYFHEKNFSAAAKTLKQLGNSPSLSKPELDVWEPLNYAVHLEEVPSDRAQTLMSWENFSKQNPATNAVYVRRWKTVARLLDNPANPKTLEELRAVRKEALDKKIWEEARECDRWEAIATKNEPLFWHVYFGTPSQHLKERILKDYRPTLQVPKTFDWEVPSEAGPRAEKGKWIFDLLMGEKVGGKLPIKVGKGMHRLLALLAQDFYRSQRIPALFSQLYPTEKFDPVTSAPRVHQILNRLRVWFKKNHIPLTIEEADHAYRLVGTENVTLRIPNVESSADPVVVHLNKLKEIFPNQVFSANDAGKVLGVSGRTILRLMEKGTKLGLVNRTGKGAATRYQFHVQAGESKRAA